MGGKGGDAAIVDGAPASGNDDGAGSKAHHRRRRRHRPRRPKRNEESHTKSDEPRHNSSVDAAKKTTGEAAGRRRRGNGGNDKNEDGKDRGDADGPQCRKGQQQQRRRPQGQKQQRQDTFRCAGCDRTRPRRDFADNQLRRREGRGRGTTADPNAATTVPVRCRDCTSASSGRGGGEDHVGRDGPDHGANARTAKPRHPRGNGNGEPSSSSASLSTASSSSRLDDDNNRGNGRYVSLREALRLYANTLDAEAVAGKITVKGGGSNNDANGADAVAVAVVRGRIRVVPGKPLELAFVACDRGSLARDVMIKGRQHLNGALDGDTVYVRLMSPDEADQDQADAQDPSSNDRVGTLGDGKAASTSGEINGDGEAALVNGIRGVHLTTCNSIDDEDDSHDEGSSSSDGATSNSDEGHDEELSTWRDDEMQRQLWDPAYDTPRPPRHFHSRGGGAAETSRHGERRGNEDDVQQFRGRVIHVAKRAQPTRAIVGTLRGNMLVPTNRSLPFFIVSRHDPLVQKKQQRSGSGTDGGPSNPPQDRDEVLYRAQHAYGRDWPRSSKFPHCRDLTPLGNAYDPEDETVALLEEYGVNHGEFKPAVLRDVEAAVRSGRTGGSSTGNGSKAAEVKLSAKGDDCDWEPTAKMLRGRRDFRDHRVFTIDPTTAKDLDDALHIKPLPGNRVEIGVHIADVSHFVRPGTAVDDEAANRATTVYLVDRTVPMLPRPLCEIACSLNENVDRLAFSCVWTMNLDGTLAESGPDDRDGGGRGGRRRRDGAVWYGRSVIRSCARLDYSTAQNIIDGKVAAATGTGDDEDADEKYWPRNRRPTGGHTMGDVAGDVRLMHTVAMARRKLRFDNGALALHGIKLAFQLSGDGKVPELCEPYPIKDSNRLIEEFMLMANYLVAQRLITHSGGLALLRNHPPPVEKGLWDVVDVAEKLGFEMDVSSSKAMHDSLRRMSRECNDDVVLQGITEMLMVPMQPATYFAAGEEDEEDWRHFALNIPYYTHFTSPIRRYADVIVHRLLQATLDGEEAVRAFALTQKQIHSTASHCNDKRMDSKKAQERSDRVFLSLYLRKNPIDSVLAIVTSVGEKAFTAFIPSLGLSQMVFEDDHDSLNWEADRELQKILISRKPGGFHEGNSVQTWSTLNISVFAKVRVACRCKDKPPIDVKLSVVGPCL